MTEKFTGLLDRHLEKILYGDMLHTGMRRDDARGWTLERVTRGVDGLPCLEDPTTLERSQMQWDQELRILDRNVDLPAAERSE